MSHWIQCLIYILNAKAQYNHQKYGYGSWNLCVGCDDLFEETKFVFFLTRRERKKKITFSLRVNEKRKNVEIRSHELKSSYACRKCNIQWHSHSDHHERHIAASWGINWKKTLVYLLYEITLNFSCTHTHTFWIKLH